MDLVLKLPAGTVTSTFTVAVFINEALAKAYQLQQGKVYNVKKSADAASSSCPAMPVFSHASVPHGHICMAPAVMHHLALPENSQVCGCPTCHLHRPPWPGRSQALRRLHVALAKDLTVWTMCGSCAQD